jgi:NAD(P)-dependent dehydrogenase (short-subunit alcohol dehydrogenase family)
VCPADSYVGPPLAVVLAQRGYDLVVANGDDVVDALHTAGAQAISVPADIDDPACGSVLTEAALDRFGAVHSAFLSRCHPFGIDPTGSGWRPAVGSSR